MVMREEHKSLNEVQHFTTHNYFSSFLFTFHCFHMHTCYV